MLWIDTDMGFDDMLAVLMLSQSGRNIAGMSLVFGNTPLAQVRKNTAAAIELFNWSFPVFCGAERPNVGEMITAQAILGEDGMPSLGLKLPEANAALSELSAYEALVDWLENLQGEAELVALGPLTNIATLALGRPELLEKLSKIVWMGGSVGRGNHTEFAEFNALADPEALKTVIACGVPFYMVDLETCRQVLVSPSDLAAIVSAKNTTAQILHDLLGGYINIAISRGRKAMALYDPVAAAACIDLDAISFQPANIVVELKGRERGCTKVSFESVDKHNSNCFVSMKADCARTKEMALGAILRACA